MKTTINVCQLTNLSFYFIGTYVSLTSVVLVDLLGLEKLTNAFGLILLFQGIASIVGPPFIGCLYDVYGNHDIGFYIIGNIEFNLNGIT